MMSELKQWQSMKDFWNAPYERGQNAKVSIPEAIPLFQLSYTTTGKDMTCIQLLSNFISLSARALRLAFFIFTIVPAAGMKDTFAAGARSK
jgi:hypothetical protein